jgi:hypothetical protein
MTKQLSFFYFYLYHFSFLRLYFVPIFLISFLFTQGIYSNTNKIEENSYSIFEESCKEFTKELLGESTYLLMGFDTESACISVHGEHEGNDKVRITFINGILSTGQNVLDAVDMFSKAHGGKFIHYVFRPTQGWTWDITAGMMVKIAYKYGYTSYYAHLIVDLWRKMIQEMGGVDGGGTIIHYAHSLGGTETDRAGDLLTPEEKKMIRITTFGSATLVRDQGFQKVTNYVSMNDGVCSVILEPVGHIKAIFDPDTNVVYHGELNYTGFLYGLPSWPLDHLLTGPTYCSILQQMGEDFIKEFY